MAKKKIKPPTFLEVLIAQNHPAVRLADRRHPAEHGVHVHRLISNYLHMPKDLAKRGVRLSSILSKKASARTMFASTVGGLLGGYLLHDFAKQHGGYGVYLFPHKYYVYNAARQLGVDRKRAAKHDMSKLTPHEWNAWSAWFNGPHGLHARPDRKLYLHWKTVQNEHQKKNEHHWRSQGLAPSQVPLEVKLETIADWYGVNRATGITKQSFKEWYKTHRNTLQIDNETKEVADKKLGIQKTAIDREAWLALIKKYKGRLPGPDFMRSKLRDEQDYSSVASDYSYGKNPPQL